MLFTTLFFDLDNTLYPSRNGLWNVIGDRMNDFMIERVGLPPEQVPAIRHQYFETYGTTLRGLLIHYPDRVNADDYLAYVHDLPLQDYLQPDPELRDLLLTFPQPCWIFTNADADHARRVLNILAVSDCFDGIVDLRALDFACKPEIDAYRRALTLAGEMDPSRCVLFDDSPYNLAPAKEMGFYTVLVGTREPSPTACRSVASLDDLPEAMPELWLGS